MAEKLFWAVYEHLGNLSPRFVSGKAAKRFARKFKRTIHVVDSTTIQLIASCLDWAKHRRRKAAAKCHLRLDLQSFLPRFAIIDTAREDDAKRARELCAGIKDGEIVIFDKAYVDFEHLCQRQDGNPQRWTIRNSVFFPECFLPPLLLKALLPSSAWSFFARGFALILRRFVVVSARDESEAEAT